MNLPTKVEIIEVCSIDSLNKKVNVTFSKEKIDLINALNTTGLKRMEPISLVNPVSALHEIQLKNGKEVFAGIQRDPEIQYMVMIASEEDYESAVEMGANALSFLIGASEQFNLNILKKTTKEMIIELEKIIQKIKINGLFLRLTLSSSFGCHFEGKIDFGRISELVKHFNSLGVDEIVFWDTKGQANPLQVFQFFQQIFSQKPQSLITARFNDSNGFGKSNIMAALQAGVNRFDTAIGGIGGSSYSLKETLYVATEDVVYLLQEMEIEVGIDLIKLLSCVERTKLITKRELIGHFHNVKEY